MPSRCWTAACRCAATTWGVQRGARLHGTVFWHASPRANGGTQSRTSPLPLQDDPETQVNSACITYKEGKYDEARGKFQGA